MPLQHHQHHDNHYEFFGPTIGPVLIMLGLPLTLVVLHSFDLRPDALFTPRALLAFLAYMAFQVLLHLILPGEIVRGVAPHHLPYKLTGLKNFVVTVAVAVYFGFFAPPGLAIDLSYLYDEYVPLMTTSVVFSTVLSAYLYRRSFRPGAVLAEEGSRTGRAVYEFFLGRELNPRVGDAGSEGVLRALPGAHRVGRPEFGHGAQAAAAYGRRVAVDDPGERLPGDLRARLARVRACYFDDDGHHDGRVRVHAGVWRPGLGAVLLLAPDTGSRDPLSLPFVDGARGHRGPEAAGLCHVPRLQLAEGRVPARPKRTPGCAT